MNHPEVVIFTNKRDITTDYIVRSLRVKNTPFVRINTEDVGDWRYIHKIGQTGSCLKRGETTVSLDLVRGAYFRRPSEPIFSNHDDPGVREYCREEWSYLLRSMYFELAEKWLNHPAQIIRAEDKLMQLKVAKDLNFSIPETVVTNSKQDLADLFSGGPVVAKPLTASLIERSGDELVIFTSTLSSADEIDDIQLRWAPVIFQRKIVKSCDLRVTVVGDQVFCARIDSQSRKQTETDWRHSSVAELEHEIWPLPDVIAQQCIQLVKVLGLRFGAIDLVLDNEQKYWFLECNPNGQWAWIENRTGLKISNAIVEIMLRI